MNARPLPGPFEDQMASSAKFVRKEMIRMLKDGYVLAISGVARRDFDQKSWHLFDPLAFNGRTAWRSQLGNTRQESINTSNPRLRNSRWTRTRRCLQMQGHANTSSNKRHWARNVCKQSFLAFRRLYLKDFYALRPERNRAEPRKTSGQIEEKASPRSPIHSSAMAASRADRTCSSLSLAESP